MITPLRIDQIQKNYQADRNWRLRRHSQITVNYELARDTVIINRLTQRQSVNVPYMKKTLKTYLTQRNWPVDNEYEDKGNDGQKELFLNAYWTECADRLRLDILEEVDRKQEWLAGRSYMKCNIIDGWFNMEVVDWFNVLLDRYMRRWDLQSARRITHIGIFRTLSDLKRNPLYDATVLKKLEVFYTTEAGIVKAGQNALAAADAAQRMNDMGVPDVMSPIVGETYVELNECQQKVWDEQRGEDVVMVIVTANGTEILMQKPLEDILGVNQFTWASWAGDVDQLDVYTDGGADSVRGLNLAANARWSQKVENGTLVNYGMNFYDSTAKEGWTPVGYDPAPFGFYPLPGKPSDVLQTVQIPEMEDVFNELNFIDGEIQGVAELQLRLESYMTFAKEHGESSDFEELVLEYIEALLPILAMMIGLASMVIIELSQVLQKVDSSFYSISLASFGFILVIFGLPAGNFAAFMTMLKLRSYHLPRSRRFRRNLGRTIQDLKAKLAEKVN